MLDYIVDSTQQKDFWLRIL